MHSTPLILCTLLACSLAGARARAQNTILASLGSSGAQGNAASTSAALSNDASQVAFASSATNLVPGDSNSCVDVFVRNLSNGVVSRVSLASQGTQANADSLAPALSADGRYVAFESSASNLVPGDTNAASDIFVHDRVTGTTERVSVDSGGAQADSASFDPALSADGRYVAFESFASNLVPADTNLVADVFVHDRLTGATWRVSVDSAGTPGDEASLRPAISADGRLVAFQSLASNLVAGDTNATLDVYVHDRLDGSTTRVSVATGGAQADGASLAPAFSADGTRVAFHSSATQLVPGDSNGFSDVFVHERASATTRRVSVDSAGLQGNANSTRPALSADGRFVAFQSLSTNLAAGDSNAAFDVFVHDLVTGITLRASVDSGFGQAKGPSSGAAISSGGRFVAFESAAANLAPGDGNGSLDVFLHDAGSSAIVTLCFGDGSVAACPCGNNGGAGRGCDNSAGTSGAVLLGGGSASLSASTLTLSTGSEPPGAASLFLQGTALVDPVAFGDGLRCTGGALRRLYLKLASGGSAHAPEAGDASIPQRSAALGDTIPVGATRFYQTYYRDPAPGFCPAPAGSTWNVTQALAVVWSS